MPLTRSMIEGLLEQRSEFDNTVSTYQLNLCGADAHDCAGTPGYQGERHAFCWPELEAYRDTLPTIRVIKVDEIVAEQEEQRR